MIIQDGKIYHLYQRGQHLHVNYPRLRQVQHWWSREPLGYAEINFCVLENWGQEGDLPAGLTSNRMSRLVLLMVCLGCLLALPGALRQVQAHSICSTLHCCNPTFHCHGCFRCAYSIALTWHQTMRILKEALPCKNMNTVTVCWARSENWSIWKHSIIKKKKKKKKKSKVGAVLCIYCELLCSPSRWEKPVGTNWCRLWNQIRSPSAREGEHGQKIHEIKCWVGSGAIAVSIEKA